MSKTALRTAGISLAVALACGLSAAANAQLVARKDISAAMALTMAETAVATCKTNGYNVSANVVGRNGEVIVAMRGDNTGPHTLENSMKKAYTAKAQRRSSGEFATAVKDNPVAGALSLTNIPPAQGAGDGIVLDGRREFSGRPALGLRRIGLLHGVFERVRAGIVTPHGDDDLAV